jgi:hypothetical protein
VIVPDDIHWFEANVVESGETATAGQWREFTHPLDAYRGREVGLVVKIQSGGRRGRWSNEEAFLDEFSVRTR